MGQYYRIVNIDKKQMLMPFDYDNGMKLMEWSYDRNYMVLALMNLLADAWKGDRVYVIGDYADLTDPEEPWFETLRDTLEELHTDDLYRYAGQHFGRIMPAGLTTSFSFDDSNYPPKLKEPVGCIKDNGYRYIYNHAVKQYIDIKKCPVEWSWRDSNGRPGITKISPLALLLAMGNGRGGGDYFDNCRSYELVGTWCRSSQNIEVSKVLIPGFDDYQEFAPDFTEQNEIIPWTEEQTVLERAAKGIFI